MNKKKKNNERFSLLICIVLTIFLVSCAASSSNKKPKAKSESRPESTIPSWFLNPKEVIIGSDLYGVGSDSELETAKKRALANISANLQLQIQSSSTNRRTAIRKGNKVTSTSQLDEEINLQTKAIRFTGVETNKVENIKDVFYVLLTVDLDKQVEEYKRNLEKNVATLQQVSSSYQQKPVIEKMILFSNNNPIFEEAKKSLENLEVFFVASDLVDLSEDYLAKQLSFLNGYEELVRKAKNEIVIYIVGKEEWSIAKEVFSNALQNEGYETSIQSSPGAKYDVSLHLNGKIQKQTLLKEVIQVKIFLTVELKNQKNLVERSGIYQLKANSLISEQDALEKAQKKLIKGSSKQDILLQLNL